MNNPAFEKYQSLKAQLAQKESDLAVKRAWLKLQSHDEWVVMEAWFAAQIAAKQAAIAADKPMDLAEFHAIRAEIRLLHKLLNAGRVDLDSVAKLEEAVKGLRNDIRLCEDRGFNVDHSRPKIETEIP